MLSTAGSVRSCRPEQMWMAGGVEGAQGRHIVLPHADIAQGSSGDYTPSSFYVTPKAVECCSPGDAGLHTTRIVPDAASAENQQASNQVRGANNNMHTLIPMVAKASRHTTDASSRFC
jgi:hypothetical protein